MTKGITRRAALAAPALAAATLAAPAVRAQATTVTFRFNDPEAPQLRAALDEFEQRQTRPSRSTMQRVSWADAQRSTCARPRSARRPTSSQLAFVWPRAFGGAGALRPIDDLIRATAAIGMRGWDDFLARDLADRRRRQDLRRALDHRHLRADVQHRPAAAGRRRRRSRTTWDELRGASRAIHQRPARPAGLPRRQLRHADDLVLPQLFYWWSKGPG